MFFDESHVMMGQLGGMYRGDRSRKETLVNYGFRLPSALDNRTESEINRALEELSERCRELTMIIIAHRETSLRVCDRVFDLETNRYNDK